MVYFVIAGHLLAESDAILQRFEEVARKTLAEYALDPLSRLIRSGRGELLQPQSLQVSIQGHGDGRVVGCRGIRFRVAPWQSWDSGLLLLSFARSTGNRKRCMSGRFSQAYVSEGNWTLCLAVLPSLARLLVAGSCFG